MNLFVLEESTVNNVCFYKSPGGEVLKISDDGINIKEISFVQNACGCCLNAAESRLGHMAKEQLAEYFAGGRKSFELPIDPDGTQFQKKVWRALCDIPYGQLRSYRDIAQAIDCPKAFRAVGGANNRNPIVIVIPCHRVICADMSIGGYGEGIEIKRKLLTLEKSLDMVHE